MVSIEWKRQPNLLLQLWQNFLWLQTIFGKRIESKTFGNPSARSESVQSKVVGELGRGTAILA